MSIPRDNAGDEDLHAIERNALLGSPSTDYTTGKTMADLVDGVKPLRTKLTEVALRSSRR